MSDGAAAPVGVQTATPAPAKGEPSSTGGAEVITQAKMAEFLNKRRAAQGLDPIAPKAPSRVDIKREQGKVDRQRSVADRARDASGRFQPKDPEAKAANEQKTQKIEAPAADPTITDEPVVSETDEVPEAEAKDEQKDPEDPEVPEAIRAQVEALTAKVEHYTKREDQWSEVVDKIASQRDFYKARLEHLEASLPEHGLEVDPAAKELLSLQQRVAEFEAAQKRQQEAQQRQIQAERQRVYTETMQATQAKLGALARQYPELDPRKNPEIGQVLRRAAIQGWDLEQEAIAYVQRERSKKLRAPSEQSRAPAVLGGNRPRTAPAPTAPTWESIRAYHRNRHTQG